MLRKRVEDYLETSGITKARFCRRIGITYNYLRIWLLKRVEFSDELIVRITEYLDEYEKR